MLCVTVFATIKIEKYWVPLLQPMHNTIIQWGTQNNSFIHACVCTHTGEKQKRPWNCKNRQILVSVPRWLASGVPPYNASFSHCQLVLNLLEFPNQWFFFSFLYSVSSNHCIYDQYKTLSSAFYYLFLWIIWSSKSTLLYGRKKNLKMLLFKLLTLKMKIDYTLL